MAKPPHRVARQPRTRVSYPAQVLVNDRPARCTVRNLSAGGALLLFAEPVSLRPGDVVRLSAAFDDVGQRLDCAVQVKWRREDFRDLRGAGCTAVGVHFEALDEHAARSLEHVLLTFRPAIIVVGEDSSRWAQVKDALRSSANVELVPDAAEAFRALEQREVCAVVCGAALAGAAAARFLTDLWQQFPHCACTSVVLAAGDLEAFQDLVDHDRVFYLANKPIPASELLAIVRSAVESYRLAGRGEESPRNLNLETPAARAAVELIGKLDAGSAPERVGALVETALTEIAGADRAYCLFYRDTDAVLWSAREGAEPRVVSAAAGIAGFVARTGAAVVASKASDDPRYDRDADDPAGSGLERLLVEPILGAAADGATPVLAVLVASRGSSRAPFGEEEVQGARWLAWQLAPLIARLMVRTDLDAAVERASIATAGTEVYRVEALQHYARGASIGPGSPLQLNPRWVGWLYETTVTLALFAIAFLVLGHVREFAEGPAVIRVDGRTPVTAVAAGSVAQVDVDRGARVRAGQALARLNDAEESAALARLDQEFEVLLLSSLRAPADVAARQRLAETRVERELARARLEQRTLRAPRDGTVTDLRIRVGQFVNPGEQVAWLVEDSSTFSVAALVPGQYRPQIEVGAPVRLEIAGYSHAYQDLAVESVGDVLIGPSEMRRLLGPDVPDGVIPTQPMVIVHARLPAGNFTVDAQQLAYFDGMLATASVRVRSERIILSLVPGLRALLGNEHG